MNSRFLSSVIALVCAATASLSSVAAESAAKVQSAPKRSVQINTYNMWHARTDNASEQSKMLEVLSKCDNIVYTEGWPSNITPQTIKAINPDAKVYRLYDLMVKNPGDTDWTARAGDFMQTPLTKQEIDKHNWWLRDGDGKIVKDDDVGLLLDVGKEGFKEVYLRNMLQRIEGKGFDGIVFDYVWTDLSVWLEGKPRTAAYPTEQDWFVKAWQPFLNYIVEGLHKAGYKVVGNAGQYKTRTANHDWSRAKFDAVVYERWTTPWSSEKKQWYSGADIEKRIKSFASDPREVWVSDFGLRGTNTEYDRRQRIGLALYYIALPTGTQSKRSYHHIKNGNVFWEAAWDFNIGTPVGAADKMDGKYFWSRAYTNGTVLLNYDDKPVIFALSDRYKDANGKIYSGKVDIPAHSALILQTAGD